ncbi:TPA: hypothetical protein ACH3X2_002648 [Trebouxia sp. C0005]
MKPLSFLQVALHGMMPVRLQAFKGLRRGAVRRSNKLTQAAAVYSELASGNQGIVVRDKTTGWVPLWNPMSSMALQVAATSQKMKPFLGCDDTSKPYEHQLDHSGKYEHDTHLEGKPPLNAPLNMMSAFVFKIAFVLNEGPALAASQRRPRCCASA